MNNEMNIKLKITKEDTVTELEINNPDEAVKVLLIQNVFNLYGSEVSLDEILNLVSKIGKSYKSFYEEMEQVHKSEEKQIIETKEADTQSIREKMINGLTTTSTETAESLPEDNNTEMVTEPENTTEPLPEGMQMRGDVIHYRLRYTCPICSYKANHNIPKDVKKVKCHSCTSEMDVEYAHPNSNDDKLLPDYKNNFFRAGEYRDWKLWL